MEVQVAYFLYFVGVFSVLSSIPLAVTAYPAWLGLIHAAIVFFGGMICWALGTIIGRLDRLKS